ncbi:MAG: hypothetical protein L6Q92_00585 [Phycisphaerae bacterium]|nr:hypothetical protein [Phycisphaerae bacterium]
MRGASDVLDAEHLMRLLERQRDAHRRLRELADRQRSLLDADDPTALLSVLADRQRVVEELRACSVGLSPFRQSWTTVVAAMSADARARVRGLIEENERTLASVIRDDATDVERLTQSRRQLAGEMARCADGSRAARAYGPAAAVTTRVAVTDECA